MKRLVLMLAVVALVATVAPLSVAHAADNVSVHVINDEGEEIDVWMSGQRVVTGLGVDGETDITITAGAKQVVVCRAGSGGTVTPTNCNSSTLPVTPLAFGQFDFVGGHNVTLVFGGGFTCPVQNGRCVSPTFGFTNDLSETATGNARFSLNNATGAFATSGLDAANSVSGYGLNVCFDGEQRLTNVLSATPGTTLAPGSEVEFRAGTPVSVQIGVTANCADAPATLLDLAAGTNTVVTVTFTDTAVNEATAAADVVGAVGLDYYVQVLFVDAVDIANVPVDAAFCAALRSVEGISAQIKATFGAVVAGDPATSPSKFQVKSLVDTINAAIKAGDAHVPNLQKGYWETAKQDLELLAAQLTAAGFDWNKIPTADQQLIIDNANGVNQTPDQALDTATEGLTNYAVAHCLSASTVKGSGPKFTG